MFDWIKNHIYELNFFVAGWCAFATFDCLTKGEYVLSAMNGVLVFVNIKLARTNK